MTKAEDKLLILDPSQPPAPALFELEDAFVDIDAIEEGRWVPLGADFPGVEIFTVGLSSKGATKYKEMLERTTPRKNRHSNGQLTEETREVILKQVVSTKCITDWRGVGSGGKPLPFTKEKLEYLLAEPKARRLAAAMINAITDLEVRKAVSEEEITKN